MGLLTIGALAEKASVTVRTLRYYEEVGLIYPVKRSNGGYRLFHPRSLKRIQAIQALQEVGYSLEAIVTTLGLQADLMLVDSKSEQVQQSRELLQRQREAIQAKLALLQELDESLAERLAHLNKHCTPCIDTQEPPTCEQCQHSEVHAD